ncbi:MAG TPA: NHLP leader peptide family RiPP precursor [Thermoanaerobaculia bacterium]|nr:NHLP leader peptide family RiPP precursor [Thermoanaerobaculia bacterium]
MSRGEVQDLLTKFATSNPKYRDALLKDPKGILEKQLNTTLPAGVKIKAVEETGDTLYVVVPFVPKKGEELSENALEMVAGGFMDNNCNEARGGICTSVSVKLV